MTYIDQASAIRMNVVRLVVTRDTNGNVVDQTYSEICGEHWADLQPLSDAERVRNEQLKIEATHKVYPEPKVEGVLGNDFYRDAASGKLYRIVESYDFRTLGYFRVWDGAFGMPSAETISKLFFAFDNVGPGTYTFGSGVFAAVPAFDQAPDIIGLLTNDGSFYIDSVTATGFRIVDRGIGVSPLASVYLWERPLGLTDTNRWSFTGVGPGAYTFGTAPLTGMPSSFAAAPIIYTQDNNSGQHYLTGKTTTGFTVVDKFIGQPPSITVVIVRT